MIYKFSCIKNHCTYCFDRFDEYLKWAEISKEEYVQKTQEDKRNSWNIFLNTELKSLEKMCVRVCVDYEEIYICLDCLTEMVSTLAKASGELVFVERV